MSISTPFIQRPVATTLLLIAIALAGSADGAGSAGDTGAGPRSGAAPRRGITVSSVTDSLRPLHLMSKEPIGSTRKDVLS